MRFPIFGSVGMLLIAAPLLAHGQSEGASEFWLQWFGRYHYIFVHFPITLVVMTCIAEILGACRKDSRYDLVVNFLLASAALFVIPTVISGLALEESGAFSAETHPQLEWHEIFGFATLIFIFVTLFLRYCFGRSSYYLWSLLLLLILVLITSHLGGEMAFGKFEFLPGFF